MLRAIAAILAPLLLVVTAPGAATAHPSLQALPDLVVSVTDSPDPAVVRGDLAYTVNILNAGSQFASLVTLRFTIDGAARFESVVNSLSMPSGSARELMMPGGAACDESAGVLVCVFAVLPRDTISTFRVIVTPRIAGTLNATADVSSEEADANVKNNRATESTTVTSDSGLSRPAQRPVAVEPPQVQPSAGQTSGFVQQTESAGAGGPATAGGAQVAAGRDVAGAVEEMYRLLDERDVLIAHLEDRVAELERQRGLSVRIGPFSSFMLTWLLIAALLVAGGVMVLRGRTGPAQ